MGLIDDIKRALSIKTAKYQVNEEACTNEAVPAMTDIRTFVSLVAESCGVKVVFLDDDVFTVAGKDKKIRLFVTALKVDGIAVTQQIREKPVEYLSVIGYSKKYGVNENTVRHWCFVGKLKAEKMKKENGRAAYLIPDNQGIPVKNEAGVYEFLKEAR